MKKILFVFSVILFSSCGVIDMKSQDSIKTNPSDYNQVLKINESIYVDFDYSPDHSSAQAAFEVQDCTGRVGGTFSWEKSIMTFHPQQDFSVARRYLLKYAGQVLDTSGKKRTYNIYIPFFYVNQPESAPQISMTPADGSVIQGQEKVIFTFSKGMDADTLSRSFSITPSDAFSKVWNSSCTQLTVTPVITWQEHTVYTFTFSQDMCTKAGVPLNTKASWVLYSSSGAKIPEVQYVFTVLNDGIDFPVILSGLNGITGQDAIQITFTEEMDREKTENALSVVPHIQGRTYWTSDSTLLFIPETAWEDDINYNLFISTVAESRKGFRLKENYGIRFSPNSSGPVLMSIDGKISDGFPITAFKPEQEIEINVGTGQDSENIYTFGFVLSRNLATSSEKEAFFSGVSLKSLFPHGTSNPKVLSQFWTGDKMVHITYTGFVPDGRVYSLTAAGEKITVRTK
ncbi:MAG: Ig-like domain-containing protein [Spirochaetia bacterium]|nr:Ig-like domain-containing protein [Spirochaetia bacterium]